MLKIRRFVGEFAVFRCQRFDAVKTHGSECCCVDRQKFHVRSYLNAVLTGAK
jgi:hypothetical protein